jgi:cytochrome c oxidase subunit 1
VVAGQLLAGILFFFGGIGGLTNASYNINLVIHNTAWVPGHFHLTVASAVTLSFMAISYWLVPYLTGKPLWKPKLAVAQVWTWFVGMMVFSNAMHTLGLLGAPRRTPLGLAPYIPEEWNWRLIQTSLGGAILLVGAYMYVTIVVATAYAKSTVKADIEVPEAEAMQDPALSPVWTDKWAPWLLATVVLIVIAYGPQLIAQISNIQLTSPGFKVW